MYLGTQRWRGSEGSIHGRSQDGRDRVTGKDSTLVRQTEDSSSHRLWFLYIYRVDRTRWKPLLIRGTNLFLCSSETLLSLGFHTSPQISL